MKKIDDWRNYMTNREKFKEKIINIALSDGDGFSLLKIQEILNIVKLQIVQIAVLTMR